MFFYSDRRENTYRLSSAEPCLLRNISVVHSSPLLMEGSDCVFFTVIAGKTHTDRRRQSPIEQTSL